VAVVNLFENQLLVYRVAGYGRATNHWSALMPWTPNITVNLAPNARYSQKIAHIRVKWVKQILNGFQVL